MKSLFLKLIEPVPIKEPVHITRDELPEIRKLAERRGLLMLLHKRLTENMAVIEPKEEVERFIEKLQPLRYVTIARSIRLENISQEILRLLGREGIPAVVLRGNAIARDLYGDPYCRSSSDIDLLIRRSDVVPADSALCGIGCRRDDPLPLMFWINRVHHAVYVYPETCDLIEIHWDFGIPSYFRLASEEIWAEVFFDASGILGFSMEMDIIQLLIHHHMHAFRELKILVDILWALLKYDREMDWNAFADRLRKMGLLKTAMITLAQINSIWKDIGSEMECIKTLMQAFRYMGGDLPGYLLSYFRMEIDRDYRFQANGDKLMSRFALDGAATICLSFLKSFFPMPDDIKALYEDKRGWALPLNYSRFITWRLTEWKK